AEDLAGAVGDDLDVAIGRMLYLGAVVLAIGPAQDADDTALHPGLLLEKADLGQFGIGINYRGYGTMVDPERHAKQRVADHQTGVVIGGVRGRGSAGDLTHRVDALVGGAQ